jgi:hypothetical protein
MGWKVKGFSIKIATPPNLTMQIQRCIIVIEKGAAGRRLSPIVRKEVTAELGSWGGYFFLFA